MLNRPKPERVVNEDQGVDTAWKIHAAIVDWTGKVDTKASFASALESAAIVSLSASGRRLSGLSDWPRATLWIGIGCLLCCFGSSQRGCLKASVESDEERMAR